MPETYAARVTLSLKDLRAEKPGTRVAEIVIALLVLGLRPGAGWFVAKNY